MKKIISIMIIALFMFIGCECGSRNKVNKNNIKVIENEPYVVYIIDGCEYININSKYGIALKGNGNCGNKRR
jgi:uncharacterized protein YcfL